MGLGGIWAEDGERGSGRRTERERERERESKENSCIDKRTNERAHSFAAEFTTDAAEIAQPACPSWRGGGRPRPPQTHFYNAVKYQHRIGKMTSFSRLICNDGPGEAARVSGGRGFEDYRYFRLQTNLLCGSSH